MSPKILKSAVVGLGIGTQHALAILENPYCNLSRIVDIDHQKANNFIAKHSSKGIINSHFDDVMNDKEINLVSIASFDDHHYEQVISLLKANKNVFVEKPLCQTKDQLHDIHQIFLEKRKNRGIASNLVLRTAELYKYIKNLLLQIRCL
ncbi:MAG TPA: Gfo/Idh/MocA family oxidoreductase [Gammaproteobacteria bacterium]|nr:Gfo/Idh/MocA family oxidoreductase [Gammaproteobacteria bacterium]